MESARRAVPGDEERLADLAARAVAEVQDQRGGLLHLAGIRPYAAADLHRADTLVLVGCIDDVVVGYLLVRLTPLGDLGTVGQIDGLYVEPGARDVGVGEAMMVDALAWCDAEGCTGVDAVALPGDRATKNFFERFGLTARAIVVHRSFGS
jgi:ribosomal protein S18 acetylase RimI-like enzyme